MSSTRTCLLLLAILVGRPLAAADNNFFLGQIRVDDDRTSSSDPKVLHYQILHEDPAQLQTRLSGWISQSEAVRGRVSFSMDGYPVASTPAAGNSHHAASFLIDYTEPAVQALARDIESRYGTQPAPDELEQYVHDYIEDKNVAHGFDVASMVAKSRAGDCTEHAVLLTALLRMFSYPARTVTGLYVSLQDPVLAYGHAWTEYYGDNGWSGLDGTRISDTVGAQHVPLSVVDDESITYTMGLISTLQILFIDRVVVK